VVNVNPLYTAEKCVHMLKHSGARGIVICDENLSTLNEIIEET